MTLSFVVRTSLAVPHPINNSPIPGRSGIPLRTPS